MTHEKINDSNKLIAEFMGHTDVVIGTHYNEKRYPSGTAVWSKKDHETYYHDYNISWDWLMPVVEKILNDNTSCCSYGAPHYFSEQEEWRFTMLDDQLNDQQGEGDTMIDSTYKTVVKFITWYNKNQKL